MPLSFGFARVFFLLISTIFSVAFCTTLAPEAGSISLVIGVGIGVLLTGIMMGLERLLHPYSLRSLNVTTLGLFAGYLLALAFNTVLSSLFLITKVSSFVEPQWIQFLTGMSYLMCLYVGLKMAFRSTENLHLSIPFVQLKTTTSEHRRTIIPDYSVLSDPRVIDLANSGIVDQGIVIPRFLMDTINSDLESSDESTRSRARRAVEITQKLELMPNLGLVYEDGQYGDASDLNGKLIGFAEEKDGSILTTDMNLVQTSSVEGVRFINLNRLSTALKPLVPTGEQLSIKIQRYGKEARQGVGYLEDGTMVVVNGGGDFIGETIKVQVLSVKHTSSGRMIFCNTRETQQQMQQKRSMAPGMQGQTYKEPAERS